MEFSKIYRHGDVIIFRIREENENTKATMYGEVRPAEAKSSMFEWIASAMTKKDDAAAGKPVKPTLSLWDSLRSKPRIVLELGEVTGHSHQLQGDVEIVEKDAKAGGLLFRVLDNAVLTHEEHDAIVLEKGLYLKVTQVEYDPFADLIVKIRD